MANASEIQGRRKSIQDTMKITKAMYMMSSIKVRKAKQKLTDTEPYFYGLQTQIKSILYHFPEMEHIYFDNRSKDHQESQKRKAYIVFTADKGMAGAYNHNVVKFAQQQLDAAGEYDLFVVGELGRHYFRSAGYKIHGSFRYSSINPSVHRARVMAERLLDRYKNEEFDEVYVIYTRMTSSIASTVEVEQLLPLKTHKFLLEEEQKKNVRQDNWEQKKNSDEDDEVKYDSDFFIYPSPKKVLKQLVYNYVTGFLYGALVESFASEENSRMMAMQTATDNAEAMLKDLSIQYNRVRQAAITQEITEVIGGAKSLKRKKEKKKQEKLLIKR